LAKELIKELHPIKNTKIEASFPVVCFFVGPARKMWRYFSPPTLPDVMEPMMKEGQREKMDDASTPEARKILKL
jgi:hypothetical protein